MQNWFQMAIGGMESWMTWMESKDAFDAAALLLTSYQVCAGNAVQMASDECSM
eukprot:SAG11_NODE_4911_length_1725_cov_1.565806_1_plen_53_part_00